MEGHVQVWTNRSLANSWAVSEMEPRIDSFSRLAHVLEIIAHFCWGNLPCDPQNVPPGYPAIPTPLELARQLREAAARIEEFTATDQV